MEDSAIVTIATRNYLHYARALCESIRAVHPATPIYVCVIDTADSLLRPEGELFTAITGAELGIPNWKRFAFQYQPHELACALKPFAIEYLLKQGYQRVLYLDADIQVYSSLEGLVATLTHSDLVITPHLHAPPTELTDPPLAEQSTLKAGIFNGGFLGVRDCLNTRRFLQWWKEKHQKWCILDIDANMHADQRWLDLIVVYFENLHIERSTRYNVAYWNIHQRTVSYDGEWLVDGQPLVFFHFSGWEPARPKRLSRFGNPYDQQRESYLLPLFQEYQQRVTACGQKECERIGYEYAQLTDGTKIKPLWREAIRVELPEFAEVTDPFDTQAHPHLKRAFEHLSHQKFAQRRTWRHDQLNRFRKHPLIAPLWQLFQRFERGAA